MFYRIKLVVTDVGEEALVCLDHTIFSISINSAGLRTIYKK